MYDWAAVLRSLGLGEEKCDWEGRWNDASHSPEGRRHWREGQWEEEEYMHMHNTLPGTCFELGRPPQQPLGVLQCCFPVSKLNILIK